MTFCESIFDQRYMLAIRQAHPHEAAVLTALAHTAKAHWGYSDAWITAWRESLTFTPAYITANPVFVACLEEAVVGVYALWEDDETVYLDHMWVDPAHLRQGIGKALMQHMVAYAVQSGIAAIEIWSDPHVEGFYRHMGAQRVGTIPASMDTAPDRVLPKLILTIDADSA